MQMLPRGVSIGLKACERHGIPSKEGGCVLGGPVLILDVIESLLVDERLVTWKMEKQGSTRTKQKSDRSRMTARLYTSGMSIRELFTRVKRACWLLLEPLLVALELVEWSLGAVPKAPPCGFFLPICSVHTSSRLPGSRTDEPPDEELAPSACCSLRPKISITSGLDASRFHRSSAGVADSTSSVSRLNHRLVLSRVLALGAADPSALRRVARTICAALTRHSDMMCSSLASSQTPPPHANRSVCPILSARAGRPPQKGEAKGAKTAPGVGFFGQKCGL